MTDKQPDALALADALEAIHYHNADSILALNVIRQAGPELRRLHEENDTLRQRCEQGYAVGRQSGREDFEALLRQALYAMAMLIDPEKLGPWQIELYDKTTNTLRTALAEQELP